MGDYEAFTWTRLLTETYISRVKAAFGDDLADQPLFAGESGDLLLDFFNLLFFYFNCLGNILERTEGFLEFFRWQFKIAKEFLRQCYLISSSVFCPCYIPKFLKLIQMLISLV